MSDTKTDLYLHVKAMLVRQLRNAVSRAENGNFAEVAHLTELANISARNLNYYVERLEAEREWECPNCGETGGTPKDYDFGRSSETGYHDAGEACSKCLP